MKIKIEGYNVSVTSKGVQVGCTFVPRKTVERVLEAIKKAKPFPFRVGTRVKVVQDIDDSSVVFGRTGRIVEINCSGTHDVLVLFPGWKGGHDGNSLRRAGAGHSHWWVYSRALKVIKKG